MKLVTEAYVNYKSENNEIFGVPVKIIKSDLKPKNFNKLDYIHYVANAFTYMISLHVYFSDRNGSKKETSVIISNEQLADNIGCHISTSDRIMKTLKEIFGLEYNRRHEKYGAREITINNRVIEFLKIYSLEEFYEYKAKYNLNGKKLDKALQQLFRYRAWTVKPKFLNPSQRESLNRFLKKNQNFYHRAITDHVTDYQRIDQVKANKDKISDLNITQLERIIEEKKQGKLSQYWNKILINLQQMVTKAIRRMKKIKKDQDQESTNEIKSLIESESNQGGSVAHDSATMKHQRLPEDQLKPSEYLEVLVEWNNMLSDRDIPNIDALNQNVINAIDKQVKSIGKRKLISNIRKISGLESVSNGLYKMTFSKFMTKKTLDLIDSSNIVEDISGPSWLAEYELEHFGVVSVPLIAWEDIPTFNTITEASTWWKEIQAN